MSPPVGEDPSSELLGSLTTQQQQRTSARVIKKLKLEPLVDKKKRADGASDEILECETPNKISEELKFPTVKQRMPKALWSTDEKNLFFEALNEYGKDFDAITAYICAKMKKKGMPDINLKTKTQVSHFYYRTWHKLSKHVHFDENVKKVAQELYALINYGELRKKLVSVNEKTCGRLGEMVLGGSMMVRARGRNLRVRTPMCRALRRLNQITERACGSRVCVRATVVLRARTGAAWARVQAAAHNPRAALALPPRHSLRALLAALGDRWHPHPGFKTKQSDEDSQPRREEDTPNLDADKLIAEESRAGVLSALHVGPRADAELHVPALRAREPLSSHKVCLSSYLQRMAQRRDRDRDRDGAVSKIRTTKRQRKDSATDKDKEGEQKKSKLDEESTKLINIEETAIDGIELMASYKVKQEDERPSTEDEKDIKEEVDVKEEEIDKGDPLKEDILKVKEDPTGERGEREDGGRERDMSEKEKDSFSEMEDDEKFTKSDTDNESDTGKGKEGKFKNLKVKFRIRPKKRGGSIYTLVTDKEEDKEEKEYKEEKEEKEEMEFALRQIRKGWSVYDAGDLTIGDLYLMFGNRSKLELDYWWAEPTPPLSPPQKPRPDNIKLEKSDKTPDKADPLLEEDKGARESDTDIFSPKNFSQDSNDGSGDERKGEQLVSPEQKTSSTLKLISKLINRPQPSQPSASTTDGFSLMSERLKRLLSLAGNPHMPSNSKRCSCGHVCPPRRPPAPTPAPATTPGLTPSFIPPRVPPTTPGGGAPARSDETVFRHPTPIAPRPDAESGSPEAAGGGGGGARGRGWGWGRGGRGGRGRGAEGRVVVQRLLPLLPKLPPHTAMIPVKTPTNSQSVPPKTLPKPPPTSTSDLSFFYVLSESNGQFFFHDGDRRIPITPPTAGIETLTAKGDEASSEVKSEDEGMTETAKDSVKGETNSESDKTRRDEEGRDIGNFLGSESMSMSPTRLLREAEGWAEGAAQDFSLSSFLGRLEGAHAQPDLAVASHLHSLMAESSVDYVAKFADLAAEVTDEVDPLASDDLA